MVLKPAPTYALTALMLAEIMAEVGPPLVCSIGLTDPTPVLSATMLTAHPKVSKISFTGSTAVGVRVMQRGDPCGARVAGVSGGKSPFIVFADADLDRALAYALLANYFAQGQMCTAGSRIFVERPVYETFRERSVQARATPADWRPARPAHRVRHPPQARATRKNPPLCGTGAAGRREGSDGRQPPHRAAV